MVPTPVAENIPVLLMLPTAVLLLLHAPPAVALLIASLPPTQSPSGPETAAGDALTDKTKVPRQEPPAL